MFKLLVIDDDPEVRLLVEQVFAHQNIEVRTAETAQEGLHAVAEQHPNVILLDIRLGDRDGLEMLHELRQIDPKALVIFITGYGTAETAIETIKRGAYEYLIKPLDLTQLELVVNQALDISQLVPVPSVNDEGPSPGDTADRLVGLGPGMQTVCKQIGRLAPREVNVLILGESGTGKELVAQAIYRHSCRSQKPLLAINCAAIPESLLESELFGHERGAFTGADKRRIGKFEQANGGTLFLDEVGDMAANTQAKILRLLQERCFERVGGNETIPVDVRLIAATNQNLESLIEQGRFRRDLYYRLRGVTIRVPPLRERRKDISELAHYYLFRFNHQLGTTVQSIAPAALERLVEYHWPGNVRELQIVIREALLCSWGPILLPEFLPPELLGAESAEPNAHVGPFADTDWQELPRLVETWLAEGQKDLYRRLLGHVDRLVVSRALKQSGGNQAGAAEILGVSRVTLRNKMRAVGLVAEKWLSLRPPHERNGAERLTRAPGPPTAS